LSQYVYVIGPKCGPYKIGYASDLRQRLQNLQIGNHQKLIIHYKARTKDPVTVERLIHNELILHHIRGEWFACHRSVAIAMVQRHVIETSIDSTIDRVMALHPLAL